MKLLFVLSEVPWPVTGGHVGHVYGMLRQASMFSDVSIVCCVSGDEDRMPFDEFSVAHPEFRFFCELQKRKGIALWFAKLFVLSRGWPLTLAAYCGLGRVLREKLAAEDYDAVIFDSCKLIGLRVEGLPAVLLPHDFYSHSYRKASAIADKFLDRLIWAARASAFENIERNAYNEFQLVSFVSETDQERFRPYSRGVIMKSLPIALPDEAYAEPLSLECHSNDEPVVLIHGSFNLDIIALDLEWFLQFHIKDLINAFVGSRIVIWSRGKCTRLSRLEREYCELEFVYWVDDYFDFLNASRVYIYPQRFGSGLQTKVLQAVSQGIPVIANEDTLAGFDSCGVPVFSFQIGDAETFSRVCQDLKFIGWPEDRQGRYLRAEPIRRKYSAKALAEDFETALSFLVL